MDNINEEYTSIDGIRSVKNFFKKEGRVQLFKFFKESTYKELEKNAIRTDFEKSAIPNKYCMGKAPIPKKLLRIFHSKEFLQFISTIIGKKVDQLDTGALYRFKHKDYTLLHDDLVVEPGIDIILDFTDEWESKNGGEVTYVKDQESWFVEANPNSLTIINRKDENRFVRYVNSLAKDKKRYFVMCTI